MDPTGELFAMALIWTAIAVGIAYFFPTWTLRIAFVTIAVGVPFWELPYGYYNFRKICNEEAGLRIYEKILPQKSICVDVPLETSAKYLFDAGFSVVEVRDQKGRVSRFVRDGNGKLTREVSDQVASSYCLGQNFIQDLPWRIQRNEFVVLGSNSRHAVARYSDIVWYGTSWQQGASPVLGRGGECRGRDPFGEVAAALLAGASK